MAFVDAENLQTGHDILRSHSGWSMTLAHGFPNTTLFQVLISFLNPIPNSQAVGV